MPGSSPRRLSGKLRLLCLFLAVAFSVEALLVFRNTWTYYNPQAPSLAATLPQATVERIRVAGYFLAVGSLFFLFQLLQTIAGWLHDAFHGFSFSCVRKTLFREKWLCRLLTGILCIVTAALLCVALLCAVYTIPVQKMENNMAASARQVEQEGSYPELFSWCQSKIDSCSDAIILLTAATDTGESTLTQALLNAHWGWGLPDETLVERYAHPETGMQALTYGRYWHGYLLFLKPLLVLTDYSGIRVLNGIFQVIGVLGVCLAFFRRKRKGEALAFLLCYLLLMPIVMAKCLHYSSCLYPSLIGMQILLLRKKPLSVSFLSFFFLCLGMAVAFLDLLTYPMLPLGFCCMAMLAADNGETEAKLALVLRAAFYYAMGYVGLWAAKWILASLLTNENLIADALSTISQRTGHVTDGFAIPTKPLDCIVKNVCIFFETPFTLLVPVLSAFLLKALPRTHAAEKPAGAFLPYLAVALIPVLWYIFAQNHVATHTYFTSKATAAILFSILCGFCRLSREAHSPSAIPSDSKEVTP